MKPTSTGNEFVTLVEAISDKCWTGLFPDPISFNSSGDWVLNCCLSPYWHKHGCREGTMWCDNLTQTSSCMFSFLIKRYLIGESDIFYLRSWERQSQFILCAQGHTVWFYQKNRNCHELWYNERMKYPKIDLKTIRLQSRQFQAENPRLFLVYLLPSMLVILSGFLNPLERINESILEQSFLSVLAMYSRPIFSSISLLYRDNTSNQFSLYNPETHQKSWYRTIRQK